MSDKTDERQFRYGIDAHDRIDEVSTNWLAFARENEAPELDEEAVVGKPLLSFVDGEETRQLYDSLLTLVRNEQRAVSVVFRCDAPDRRRYMTLRIAAEGDRRVSLTARIDRVKPRPRLEFLARTMARTKELLVVCGWCRRVNVGEEWFELDEAAADLGLFTATALPGVSHGICGDCSEEASLELGEKPRARH